MCLWLSTLPQQCVASILIPDLREPVVGKVEVVQRDADASKIVLFVWHAHDLGCPGCYAAALKADEDYGEYFLSF